MAIWKWIIFKEYTQNQQLRRHISNFHGENGGKVIYRCKICNQGFTTQTSRRNHMKRIHEDNKLVENQCAFCGTSFTSEEKLTKHIAQVSIWTIPQKLL